MRRITNSLLLLLALASCQEVDLDIPDDDADIADIHDYTIPQDTAIARLYAFMNTDAEFTSRSLEISEIFAVTAPGTYSRSSDSSSDTLLYVANFGDEGGYAVMSADSRLPDDILVVAEKGSMKPSDFDVSLFDGYKAPVFPDYPKTGPGFVTTPETGDEVFINPNTASLYIDEEGEELVGNLNPQDFLYGDNATGSTSYIGIDLVEGEASDHGQVIGALCMTYAMSGGGGGNGVDHFQTAWDTGREDNGGGGSGDGPSSSYIYGDWKNTAQTPRLLFNYRNWHQDAPFNDLSPKKLPIWLFGSRKKAPAGCFPLALAKILTLYKHDHPELKVYGSIDWSMLNKTYRYNHDEPIPWDGDEYAPRLLHSISEGCDSWYFYHGTFTFPSKITGMMRRIGLANAHSYEYKTERVFEMIDAGKPVIIYSIPGVNIFASHSWNIDGYKVYTRDVIRRSCHTDGSVSYDTIQNHKQMVHCDFGWHQAYNGYYVSGLFKLGDSDAEIDLYQGTSKRNYNNLLKIIMYGKP